jgi:hypothetical protein
MTVRSVLYSIKHRPVKVSILLAMADICAIAFSWLLADAFQYPWGVALPVLLTVWCVFWKANKGVQRLLNGRYLAQERIALPLLVRAVTASCLVGPVIFELAEGYSATWTPICLLLQSWGFLQYAMECNEHISLKN